jgi:hypothetical protein
MIAGGVKTNADRPDGTIALLGYNEFEYISCAAQALLADDFVAGIVAGLLEIMFGPIGEQHGVGVLLDRAAVPQI